MAIGFKIPDEDIGGWLEVYRVCGCSENRIDEVMVVLNDTWAHQKLARIVEEEVAELMKKIQWPTPNTAVVEDIEQQAREVVFERLRLVPYRYVKRGIRYPVRPFVYTTRDAEILDS